MKNKVSTVKIISIFLCLLSLVISAVAAYFAVTMHLGKDNIVSLVFSAIYALMMLIMVIKEKARYIETGYNICLGSISLGILVFSVIHAFVLYHFNVPFEPETGAVIIVSAVSFVNAVTPLFKQNAFFTFNKTAKAIGTVILALCTIIVVVNGTWLTIALCSSLLLIYFADWLYMTNDRLKEDK